MGYSGLIYAAIVAAWLAVLVPRWVRRNEEVERARETDAANGVRVLRRRSGPLHTPHHPAADDAGDRTIVTGGTAGLTGTERAGLVRGGGESPTAPDAEGVGAAMRSTGARVHAGSARRRLSPAERALRDLESVYTRAARRRRRMLTILLLTTVTVVLGVYAGGLPAWAPTMSGAALVSFLVTARRAAVSQSARRARLRRRLTSEHSTERVQERDDSRPGGLEEGKRIAILAAPEQPESPAENTWEPVDVPLPTYVTKAKAPKVTRKIDLSRPGSWTSGRFEPERSFELPSHRQPTTPAAGDPGADDSATAEADELQENSRRRAVGE